MFESSRAMLAKFGQFGADQVDVRAGQAKQASEEVTKAELREELKKHEERETPAQEKAESPKEQEIERKAGVETKKEDEK